MTSFLDSNVIIYAFTEHADSEKSRELLRTQEDIITNTVVLLESYAKLATITTQSYAEKIAKQLLSFSNLRIVDFDRTLFFESVKRSRKYKLSVSDLIHYTTALLNNCTEIISYDKDFDNLDISRVEP